MVQTDDDFDSYIFVRPQRTNNRLLSESKHAVVCGEFAHTQRVPWLDYRAGWDAIFARYLFAEKWAFRKTAGQPNGRFVSQSVGCKSARVSKLMNLHGIIVRS